MGNFTATDWTLTVEKQTIQSNTRLNRVKMVLATSANDGYPAGGIPIPSTVGDYGMVRNLDNLVPYDTVGSASGYVWMYGSTGSVFRAFRAGAVSVPLTEATTGAVLAGQTFYVHAFGW